MATYESYPLSNGKVEIEGIDYIFDSGTDISEVAVVGEPYYDPNTGGINRHSGQKEFQTLTLTAIFSPTQFRQLKAAYDDPRYAAGSITAIHTAGGVTTKLLKVRLSELSYGSFEKLTNTASKITLSLDFSSTIVL